MADSVRQSLADRSLELEGIIESENKKKNDKVSDEDTFAFVERMKNVNTQKKTTYDVKRMRQWLSEAGENRSLEEIPPRELNLYMARMFLSIKKPNGYEYEPESLRCMYSSLHRYLTAKDYPQSIITSADFKHARDVLSSKKKSLKQMGLGNKKNRADPFTLDEINILKEKRLLGADNPEALINTMWLNNTIHFGLRGRQEHTDMLWGDFEQGFTATGRRYIMFTERATKTRNGVASDPRKFMPKMFEQPDDPDCPVKMFYLYESKRPKDMLTPESRFYLGINHHYNKNGSMDTNWYLPKPMGKNTLGDIAKQMSGKAGFESRDVNHSGRKTCISRLLDANCPPNEVVQISGHKNLLSLNSYSTVSIDKQARMSTILHGKQMSNVSSVNGAGDGSHHIANIVHAATEEFKTNELSDQELIIASQKIESVLEQIDHYENPGQVIDLPIVQSPGGTLSLSKSSFQPQHLFSDCTFNQPVNIVFKN